MFTFPDLKQHGISALAVGILVLLLTVFNWQLAAIHERAIAQQVEFSADQISARLQTHLDGLLKTLNQLRLGEARGERRDTLAFEAAAQNTLDDYSEFLGVNLIDKDRTIVAVTPLAKNAAALGQQVGQTPSILALLDEARSSRLPKATPPVELFQGGKGIVTYFPIFRGDEFAGYVNGVFRLDELIGRGLPKSEESHFAIDIADGSAGIFEIRPEARRAGTHATREVNFLDRVWTVRIEATSAMPGIDLSRGLWTDMGIDAVLAFALGLLLFALGRRQNELAESRKRFHDFANVSADWFWEQDSRLRFTYVSAGNAPISGQTPESHYGKTRRETHPLDVSEEQWAAHEKTLMERRPLQDFEFSRIDPNGKTRILSVSGRPFFSPDGRFLGYRGVGRDITEKKATERALRMFSTIVDQSPVAVIVTDLAGSIVYTNPAFTKETGYSAEEALGKNPRFLKSGLTNPETYISLWRALLSGEAWQGEFINRTKHGHDIWEKAIISPLKEHDGRSIYYVGIKQNISEEKALERRLHEAKDLAEAANQAKSTFLTLMSHELRTPLNAVIGFAELIRGQVHGPLGAKTYVEYAQDIERSGRHLLEILNDVLDLTKIETGKYPFELRKQNLAEIVTGMNAVLQSLVTKAGHRYEVKIDTPTEVVGDRRAIRQIILNLLSNAAKYTERGGLIEIGVVARADLSTELYVRDDGIGMSEADIARATELFTRIETRLAHRPEGVGIGLYIVSRLTEAMGAKLKIDSKPDAGTTVSIVFPPPPASG
jgi:PAS domain S-box-containing protein